MNRFSLFVSLILQLLAPAQSYPHHTGLHPPEHEECAGVPTNTTFPLEAHEVYRFPGTKHQLEALFPRQNGQFVVSSAIPPRLYQMDPKNVTPPVLIHEFPGGELSDLLGIAELETDVFYTATVNLTSPPPHLNLSLGTNTVWKVDMTEFETDRHGHVTSPARVSEVVVIKEAGSLNGLTSVYNTKAPPEGFILVGDAFRGVVWRVTPDGNYSIAANETTMRPVLPKDGGKEFLGTNGLKVQDGYLYYTNSATTKMFRIRIESDGYVPKSAKPELLVEGVYADDFVIDAESRYAYLAGTGTTNVVYRADLQSGEVAVLGGVLNSTSSPLIVPTAVQFGRTCEDYRSIYVTTDGGHEVVAVGTQGLTRFDVDDCALPYIY